MVLHLSFAVLPHDVCDCVCMHESVKLSHVRCSLIIFKDFLVGMVDEEKGSIKGDRGKELKRE